MIFFSLAYKMIPRIPPFMRSQIYFSSRRGRKNRNFDYAFGEVLTGKSNLLEHSAKKETNLWGDFLCYYNQSLVQGHQLFISGVKQIHE